MKRQSRGDTDEKHRNQQAKTMSKRKSEAEDGSVVISTIYYDPSDYGVTTTYSEYFVSLSLEDKACAIAQVEQQLAGMRENLLQQAGKAGVKH